MKSSNPITIIMPTLCCQFLLSVCAVYESTLLGLKCVYMTLTFRPQDWNIADGDGDGDGDEDGH